MIFSELTVNSFLCRVTGNFPTLASHHKTGKFPQGGSYNTVIFYDAITSIKKRLEREQIFQAEIKSLSAKFSGFQSKNFKLK